MESEPGQDDSGSGQGSNLGSGKDDNVCGKDDNQSGPSGNACNRAYERELIIEENEKTVFDVNEQQWTQGGCVSSQDARPSKEGEGERTDFEGASSERPKLPKPVEAVRCPRCDSEETKFCYYNNYNIKQPRYFCKDCQRYWTAGGMLRNVPVGAGKRKCKSSGNSWNHSIDETPAISDSQSAFISALAGPHLGEFSSAAAAILQAEFAKKSGRRGFSSRPSLQQASMTHISANTWSHQTQSAGICSERAENDNNTQQHFSRTWERYNNNRGQGEDGSAGSADGSGTEPEQETHHHHHAQDNQQQQSNRNERFVGAYENLLHDSRGNNRKRHLNSNPHSEPLYVSHDRNSDGDSQDHNLEWRGEISQGDGSRATASKPGCGMVEMQSGMTIHSNALAPSPWAGGSSRNRTDTMALMNEALNPHEVAEAAWGSWGTGGDESFQSKHTAAAAAMAAAMNVAQGWGGAWPQSQPSYPQNSYSNHSSAPSTSGEFGFNAQQAAVVAYAQIAARWMNGVSAANGINCSPGNEGQMLNHWDQLGGHCEDVNRASTATSSNPTASPHQHHSHTYPAMLANPPAMWRSLQFQQAQAAAQEAAQQAMHQVAQQAVQQMAIAAQQAAHGIIRQHSQQNHRHSKTVSNPPPVMESLAASIPRSQLPQPMLQPTYPIVHSHNVQIGIGSHQESMNPINNNSLPIKQLSSASSLKFNLSIKSNLKRGYIGGLGEELKCT
eukprot:CAMPEP_0196585790 /NCGR_PEP_ID=MMETSP1081-20130531/52004_1 /TAXON_ID=36882 /ORGANISM="Pyramimonas amylifera, Strain CCMP720" /LENGTH=725 /DNA_ID=CAMNT_0041907457 /DNA_START=240 /DNA_END=2418 /DNA_ORIENTATION=+